MAIKNTIIDVQSVQVLDRLYVFETTPYEIEYDESVTRIYVVDECYDAFLEVNPTAPLKTFNPEAIQAALPEWYEYVCVAIDEDSNSALLSLLYDAGLIENEDYATYAEIRAINSSQFADAFSSASSLTSFDEFELFTGVKKLGDYAFSGCPNMESIKFPDSVYKLGKNVLAGCNSLENVEVDGNNAHFYSPEGSNLIVDKTTRTIVAGCGSSTIPSDVYYIGDYAFAGSNLTEITIPSNIREIGDHAFDGCSALEYIEMESENPPKIGDNVFDDVSEDFEIDVPEDAVETYTEDDDWSQYAEYINGGQPQPHPKDLSDDEFGLESDDITITNEQMPVIIPLVNTHDLPVTYASSDTSIATVDQTGVVTLSYENGNTNITVSFAGNDEYKAKTLTYAVTVAIPQELSDAEFSWSASSATATEAGTFSGVTLTNTHGLAVAYSSSDTSVASIEPTYGHVIVSADGTTVISAAFAGNAQYKAKTVTYTLTVSLAQDLTDQEFGLSSSSTTISTEGATVTLPVINIYNLPVTYTTSNNVVATVDANGGVTLSYVDGVALISIAFAGNSTYKAKTLVYSITVDMPAQIEHVMHTTFTVSQAQVGTDTKLMRDEAHMSYFNSMIIDNVEMPVTYTYNFSTAGEHSVDYKIVKSNPDLPRTLFNGINQLNTCYMPDGITTVRYQTFFNNTGVSYVSVPNGVTSLEAQSFRGTTHLQTVYLPDTVAHINTASFRGSGIESIRIPAGVTQLISNSFESCTNLTYIEIPATVTSIESQVFYKCSNLATVVSYNTTPPALNAQAFADTALNAIYVPFANVPDYQAANNWSTYASIIQPIGGKHTLTDAEFGLSSSSTTISTEGATVTLPVINIYNLPVTYTTSNNVVATVDENGNVTLSYVDGVALISISFAGNAQYKAKTLVYTINVDMPAQIEHVMHTTFTIPQNKAGLDIPLVHENRHTSYFNSVIIDNVEMPMTYTYQFTEGIHTVDYKIVSSTPQLGDLMFNSVNQMTSAYIPDGITAIPLQLFFNNTGVSYIGVPSSVTTVAGQAFRGTTNLSSVILPDTLTSLAGETFRASGISYVNIPSNITAVPEATLMQCPNLTQFEIPAQVTTIQSQAFDRSALRELTCYNTTPPTINNINAFNEVNLTAIYVPFANVPDYQAANNWSTYASIIQPIGGKHTLTDQEFGLSSSSATITNSGSMSNYLVNTNNLPVTYSSSDSTVLTVDANGDLTVVADGSATITVSFAGNGQYLPKTLTFSATCEKAVRRALTDQEFSYDISDVENQGYLRVDMDENISDIIDDYIINEYDLPITWTIADTSVIDTDEGMIYYTNPGTTTINFVFAGNSTYLPKTVSLPVYYRGDTDLTVLYEFKDNPNNYVYTSLFNSDYLSIANNKISTIYIDGIPLNEIPNDGHCTFDTTTSEEYGTSIPLGYHTIEYKFNEVDDGYIEIPNVNNNTPLLKFGNYYGTHGGVSQWHYPAVVDIENGVERVANSALNSGWIKEITFPSSIEYIGSAVGGGTIYGDHYLKIITCYATTPPELNGNPFGSSVLKIYVPDESLSDYDNNWSYYGPYHEDILYGIDSKSRNNRGSITIKVGSTSVQTRSANSTYTATLFNESLFLDSNDNFSQYKYDEVVMETNIDSYYVPYLTGSSYTFDTDGLHTANFLLGRNNVVPAYFFEGCDDIESVTLDKCIDTIESYAFANCNSIDSVYIQKSIAYINSYAFYDTNISYLEILATTPPTLGDNVFSTEPDYISVPTAYENDYKQASGWSDYEDIINPQPKYDIDCTFNITTTSSNTWLYSSKVSSIDELYIDGVKQDTVVNEYQFDTTGTHKVQINLKSNITAVPTEMFASNTNLTECILSDRITSLGEYGTFRGASNLTYVNIPPQVTSIGSQMFQATKLSNVILPEGLTSLGFYAFNNCTLLSLVELPSTITSLGDGVFNNTIITSIEIPAGVTTMSSALYNCTHLETLISYAATPPTVTWHGLNNHAANRKIYVPAASVDLYKAAQYWSTYASDIEAIPQEGYTINYSIKAIQSKDDPDYYQNIINEWAFSIQDPQTEEREFSKEYFDEVVDSISLDGVELLVDTAEDLRRSFSTEGLHYVELVLNSDTVPSNIFCSVAVYECHVGEGITTIGSGAFCEGWQQTTGGKLYLPSTITEFQDTPFTMCGAFKLYMAGSTPPVYNVYETTDNGLFDGTSAENIIIFVPDAAVNTYKAHSTWSAYASNIRGLSAAKTNLSDADFGFYIDDDHIQDYYDAAINDPVNNTSFGLDYFGNTYNVEYTLEYDDTMFTVDMWNWFTVIDTNRWTSASNTYTITIKFNGDDAFNAKTLTYNVTTNVTTS